MSLGKPALPLVLLAALLPLPMAAACGGGEDRGPTTVAGPIAQQSAVARSSLSRTTSGASLENPDLTRAPSFGDLDAIAERGAIRVLVPLSRTFYFLDGAEQRGIAYDVARAFEEQLNDKLGSGHVKVDVVMIPVARDELISGLIEGCGDIALGNLTITPERAALVDFSDPFLEGVKEIVVTGPDSPTLANLDDLGGKEVYVRESSSYYESLTRLNERLRADGKAEMTLTLAPEVLEDEDLLEMVNAGLVPIVVVDSHKAEFWAQIFADVVLRLDLAVATDQRIGWAFRKDSPQLAAVINEFVVSHKKGTLSGNMAFNKYLKDTRWAERALNEEGRGRLNSLGVIFERYGEQYDVPWLLVAAQSYQESRLDQSLCSPAGAIGVMQLLPTTAADPNVDIPNIEVVENNVHAGVKYLRFIHDRYFADSPGMSRLDQGLFSFAAYNAGPARVALLRGKAEKMGLDPDVWFRNVEIVASQDIGRETVQYVANIYKYYIAYERILAVSDARRSVRAGASPQD
jgi:membrane-bound lytic murein transglycosylase MltF